MNSSSYGVIGEEPGGVQVSPPTQGSLYGGHAPLVGARVYILTPSRTVNYGLATSIMNTTAGTGGSSVALDVSGGATNGMYYVTTDGNGGYTLTGDYSCTAGYPVYLAAVGGSPSNALPGGNTSTITKIVGSAATGTPSTQTITVTAANSFMANEVVVLRNLTGTYAALSGSAFTVISATGTAFTFQAAYISTDTSKANGATPVAVGISTNNPVVTNMASLGTCPSTDNFTGGGTDFADTDTGAISFIYMNEVSTVAMAYGYAGFGKDAFHIGANVTGPTNSSYVSNSLNQAAFNAFLLYDIQGTTNNNNSTSAGEGHVARGFTPEENGTTPENAADTLGNILASCVDSGSVAGSLSATCKTLFSTATVDGTTTGTAAADTSAAIFNIAHYPAGVNNSSFTSTLFDLPTGIIPFTPALSVVPNDFTLAISFSAPASSIANGGNGSLINGPQVLSIDGQDSNGNEAVWIGDYYSQPVKMFTTGTPDYATNLNLKIFGNATNERSVTVDTSGLVWMSYASYGSGQVIAYTSTGGAQTYYPQVGALYALNYPIGIAFDPAGNMIVNDLNYNFLYKVSPGGAELSNNAGAYPFSSNVSSHGCIGQADPASAIDPLGNIYVIAESTAPSSICVISDVTGANLYEASGFSEHVGPNYFSIAPTPTSLTDGKWAAWASDSQGNRLVQYIFGGSTVSQALTGGGLNEPCSTAVDGGGTVWVGNGGNSSLSAFAYNSATASYYALSPASGFAPVGTYSNCGNPAVDRAGDVWVAYQGDAAGPTVVYELIGAAIPTVTPIATATKNKTLGTRPF